MAKVSMFEVTLTVFFTTIVGIFAAPLYSGERCPDGWVHVYDSRNGSDVCEPCSVICEHAASELCERLCFSTFYQLTNQQHHPQPALSVAGKSEDSPSLPPTNPSPLLLVAGVISGILVVSTLVVLGAFVCKRMQESGPGPSGAQQGLGSAERVSGLNRSRQGYRPASVREEEGHERPPQQQAPRAGMRAYCDPRQWFAAEPPADETPPERQSTQDGALLANSQGSAIQDLQQPKSVVATPIYKPSGSMRSTRI